MAGLTYDSDQQKWDIIRMAIEQHMPANRIFGFRILELKEGFAKIHVPFKEEFIGDFLQGLWHGGIIASVADSAAGIAASTVLTDARDKLNTIDLRIDYLSGAIKEDIYAEAELLKVGKRIIKADVKLYQESKGTVAIARGAFSLLKFEE
ncbi:MAG: hotdog fold thioesterase [Flavobacteriales bacterium]|nr:hotdog fold thioesterase [Flavobacteriales bacterium]